MASLVDTNILVYRFDPRFPTKQDRATALPRQGIADESIVLPHQALIEFVAAVTRPIARGAALYQMSWFDAHLWAYADERGIDTLWSEDFEHGRTYGRVKVLDPFRTP